MLHCLTSVTEGQSFTGCMTLKLKEGILEVLPGFANEYFQAPNSHGKPQSEDSWKNKVVFIRSSCPSDCSPSNIVREIFNFPSELWVYMVAQ